LWLKTSTPLFSGPQNANQCPTQAQWQGSEDIFSLRAYLATLPHQRQKPLQRCRMNHEQHPINKLSGADK
jgi:hypothetical protein